MAIFINRNDEILLMSLHFLIVDDNKTVRIKLKKKFIKAGYKAHSSECSQTAMKIFTEFLPEMVIMNFNDPHAAADLTRQMVELNFTTCVYGVANEATNRIKTEAFASGVRALIQSDSLLDGSESIEEIIHTLSSACNELKGETCLKCWEQNTYVELQITL